MLLEEDLILKDAAIPVPEITEEVTLSLEDIITQRIKNKVQIIIIYKSAVYTCLGQALVCLCLKVLWYH